MFLMKLTELRKAAGLTQEQLGKRIGRTAATINRAEKMSPTAKLQTYQLCADALGVTLADIFADNRSEVEETLIEIFRQIPEDRHDELLGLLSFAAKTHDPS